jgi:ubiquinone/menaquinone biosynthesis C-methylase UbiE
MNYTEYPKSVELISTDLPDYKDDPEAYELEEHSRPDEMLMLTVARDTTIKILASCKKAAVLDLCCGTGLSLEGIVDHPNISVVVGVDISVPYLKFAKWRFSSGGRQPMFICGDAVSTLLPQPHWDIVVLASAYHHIEDNRKVQFLSRVRELLGSSGYAVMAENILPEYEIDNEADYARSVRQFYSQVLSTAKQENPELPAYVENLIYRVAQYGCDGEYEYKVSLPLLYSDLSAAGLHIVDQRRVWPDENGSLGTGGNYVFTIRSSAYEVPQ